MPQVPVLTVVVTNSTACVVEADREYHVTSGQWIRWSVESGQATIVFDNESAVVFTNRVATPGHPAEARVVANVRGTHCWYRPVPAAGSNEADAMAAVLIVE